MTEESLENNSTFESQWPKKTLVREQLQNATSTPQPTRQRPESATRTTDGLYLGQMSSEVRKEATLELQRQAISWGSGEAFEDGMENEVSQTVDFMIQYYSTAAVDALRDLYFSGQLRPVYFAEALLWLGQIEDPFSHDARFSFLLTCLLEKDLRVRSAAAIALASLEDERAAASIAREARTEENPLLRRRLEKVAAVLGSI